MWEEMSGESSAVVIFRECEQSLGCQAVIMMVRSCYPKQDLKRLEVRNPSGFLAKWSWAIIIAA